MVKNCEGLYDIEETSTKITIGDGKVLTAMKCGKLKLRAKQIDRTTRDLVLTGVSYVPGLWHNLFSISAALKQGCKLSSEGYLVSFRKGEFKISFDQIVQTKKGFVMGIKLEPRFKVAAMSLMEGKSVSIVILHRCLGHPSEAATRYHDEGHW
jgi:hypothetical protein